MKRNRREFVQVVGAGAAGLTIGGGGWAGAAALSHGTAAAGEDDGPVLLVGEKIAVTETASGKVRGYVLRGIHHFLGIPYGADALAAVLEYAPRLHIHESTSDTTPAEVARVLAEV